MLSALQHDLQAEWRAWGTHSFQANAGLRESVVASFEQVIPHCAPIPVEVVGLRLDANAIADRVLARAVAALPEVYADSNPRNTEAHLARTFLLNLTRRAYARLIAEPGYIDTLAPQLWQDVLAWQAGMEDKQDAQTAMLRELLARTAPGIPLATAQAILAEFGHGDVPDDPAQIERLLRTAAEQYRLFEEHLRELDNSGDLVVRDLLREAKALVAQGLFDAADAMLLEAERHADLARAKVRANRGALANLRLRHRESANHYAAAARIVPEEEMEVHWRYELLRANALYSLGLDYGDNAALTEAIALYRTSVLPLAPRAERWHESAMTQNDLGAPLWILGGREGGTVRLEQAVAAYRAALEEWTRQRAPLQWAMTQNNLCAALRTIGEREGGTARLEEAVVACRAALKERTRARFPLDWALTQNNLGAALRTLGKREGSTARLEEAVTAYREALEERTRERVPLDWAMTQSNLCNVLVTLGRREGGTARLKEAVAAYRMVLEERSRERVPLGWAETQYNLGNALALLSEREGDPALAEQAVAAYHAALEERTRNCLPLDWAVTQRGLGIALYTLGRHESGTARLEQAVSAYRAALEEQTRDRLPVDWAITQNHLGIALLAVGERGGGTALVEEAVAVFSELLKEWTRDRVPLDWAATQNNLGNALSALGERNGGTALLKEAVAAYRAALEEHTRDRVPLDWATTKVNIAIALAIIDDRGGECREQSLSEIDAAVEVFHSADATELGKWADGTRRRISGG